MSDRGSGGDGGKGWTADLQRSVQGSAVHLQVLQDSVPTAMSRYKTYEDAVVSQIKGELMRAKEHPAAATGIALAASLLLLRGPRRFLFRNTLGRLQSEEARYVKTEKSVKDLNLSLDIMKKESGKLLERAALAEKELNHGQTELMNAGSQIQALAKATYKVEVQAAALMDGLREIPSREALKLRAEVASMASQLKRQRLALDKRILKLSELGVPV